MGGGGGVLLQFFLTIREEEGGRRLDFDNEEDQRRSRVRPQWHFGLLARLLPFSLYDGSNRWKCTGEVAREPDSASPADQVLVCEGPLFMAEVFEALKGMAKGKGPGSDGLPPEFYLALWDVLGEDLVEVLNASFNAGVLRRALAGRLLKTLHYVIAPDQTCGVRGRFIGECRPPA